MLTIVKNAPIKRAQSRLVTAYFLPTLWLILCAFGTPIQAQDSNSVAIEALKMNVLYIGVDNPIRIAIAEVPSSELQVQLIGAGAITGADGNYNAVVTQPGTVTIRVQRKKSDGLQTLAEQQYRVKRIPDPTPNLDGRFKGGYISKKGLLESTQIQTFMENFDFDATCVVAGYSLTVLPKGGQPVALDCVGGQISPKARELFIQLTGDGDAVFFDDVKVKCPGDGAVRNIGGVVFKLKQEGN